MTQSHLSLKTKIKTMKNLKSYHYFWILTGLLSIGYLLYAKGYPRYISDENFREASNIMLLSTFSSYCVLCVVFINAINPENKLQKGNLIEIINYIIYHTFKSKK